MHINSVHISEIKSGDAIIHNGEMVTVCNATLKKSTFMGITIFGDSYSLGYKLVKKVFFN